MKIKTISLIGTGIMGFPIAKNLLKQGYQLNVHNRSQESIRELVKLGAKAIESPAMAASSADAIITMLPDGEVVEKVLTGSDGVINSIKPGVIITDMSSTSPETPRKLQSLVQAKGGYLLDAPVSGGNVGAEEGTLSIMVGGDKEAFDKMMSVFKIIGKNIIYVGESGAGQITKCANQIIVALTIEAVSEALVLAQKSGVDPNIVRKALMGGFADSKILEVHGERMLKRDFKPGGKISTHKKDTKIALDIAEKHNLYLPGTALISQLWNAASAQEGGADLDHSALIQVLENMSQTTINS